MLFVGRKSRDASRKQIGNGLQVGDSQVIVVRKELPEFNGLFGVSGQQSIPVWLLTTFGGFDKIRDHSGES